MMMTNASIFTTLSKGLLPAEHDAYGGQRLGWSLRAQPVYTGLTDEDADRLREGMTRLDDPSQAVSEMSCGDAAACHIGAWVEEELVGVATVTRQLPPGPPMRGFFHISRLAVRDPHDSVALIDRCVAFAAAHAGRTLWVRVPLDAVDIWRGCGFSIAGEPLRGRNGGAAVLMVRRIVPRRCRAYEAEKLSPKGAES